MCGIASLIKASGPKPDAALLECMAASEVKCMLLLTLKPIVLNLRGRVLLAGRISKKLLNDKKCGLWNCYL